MRKGRNALLNVETHFIIRDGAVWSPCVIDALFWGKYLQVFDEIYVLARMRNYQSEEMDGWARTDNNRVHFLPLPDYVGPQQYLYVYATTVTRIKGYLRQYEAQLACAVIRCPSATGILALKYWRKSGKPYGIEIVANLQDDYYYRHGAIKAVLYGTLHRKIKSYAKRADGVAYVTKEVLQTVYPTDGYAAVYSSVDIPDTYFSKRLPLTEKKGQYILIHVSTLEMDSKGHEEFLQVQKALKEDGYDVCSVIVGGGKQKERYVCRAEELGLLGDIRFTGNIGQKEKLREELIHADIFLFPTRTEGLPRTLIEAMACSLPCVTSDIPTVMELMEDAYVCSANDIMGLTKRVKRLIDDVQEYNRVSERNYAIARNYEYETLNQARRSFYERLAGK